MIAVAALPTGVGSTPSPKRIGTVVAGRYRLERELGAGGMGDVFVAVQEPLGREVALKLMRAGLTGPAAQRFEREARSLATMSHPNIVTIYDYGRTDDGELFMAMELVRGLTLRQQLAHAGRLSPRATMAVLVDVCRALAATHAAGIVHRDLKPENVMLVDHGNNTSTAKVLDFGIARLLVVEECGEQTDRVGSAADVGSDAGVDDVTASSARVVAGDAAAQGSPPALRLGQRGDRGNQRLAAGGVAAA